MRLGRLVPGSLVVLCFRFTRQAPEALVKLRNALEISDATEAIIGHLRDETPAKAASHILVMPTEGGRMAEEAPLPTDIDSAIETLKRRAVAEPDFAAWLRKMAQWMS